MTDKPRGKATAHIEEYQEARIQKRRQTDRCIAKRAYDAATPYLQIVGYAILFIFIAGGKWERVSAYEGRMTGIENTQTKQQNDITELKQEIAGLQQGQKDMAADVRAIYEHLLGRHP